MRIAVRFSYSPWDGACLPSWESWNLIFQFGDWFGYISLPALHWPYIQVNKLRRAQRKRRAHPEEAK